MLFRVGFLSRLRAPALGLFFAAFAFRPLFGSLFPGFFAALALLILTVAVNLMANFVAPIYALNNLFPKQLNFRRAALISAVIGLVILPWNLYHPCHLYTPHAAGDQPR